MDGSVIDLRGAVPAAPPPAAATARGLVLSESRLEAVPDWVGELTQLEILDVAHNRLTGLPAAVASLDRLDVLYLATTGWPSCRPRSARCGRCGRCGRCAT